MSYLDYCDFLQKLKVLLGDYYFPLKSCQLRKMYVMLMEIRFIYCHIFTDILHEKINRISYTFLIYKIGELLGYETVTTGILDKLPLHPSSYQGLWQKFLNYMHLNKKKIPFSQSTTLKDICVRTILYSGWDDIKWQAVDNKGKQIIPIELEKYMENYKIIRCNVCNKETKKYYLMQTQLDFKICQNHLIY